MSADGTTILGDARFDTGDEAVRWVLGVPESLGDLPGGFGDARALDASADGSIVVGFADDAVGQQAFIWDATNGMRKLQSVLEAEFGLDLTGWRLTEASGISDDGLKIVGVGTSPGGDSRAFIADLNVEPAVPALSPESLLALTLVLGALGAFFQVSRIRAA